MADWTKSYASLAAGSVTHPDTDVGTGRDVSSVDRVGVLILHARTEATANDNPATVIIEVNPEGHTATEGWTRVAEVELASGTINATTTTNDEEAGATEIEVDDATGFAAGEFCAIEIGAGDLNLRRIVEIVGSTITISPGLTDDPPDGAEVWSDAEQVSMVVDVGPYKGIRAIYEHEGATGADARYKILMGQADAYE